jgi:omega-amidase
MRITLIQPSTVWEDKQKNFENLEHLIFNDFQKTDLVVLPEMFATGFSLNAGKLAEELKGDIFQWMTNLTVRGKLAICGSHIVRSDGKFYNHFSFVTPDIEFSGYDKRHLFSLGGENEIYTCGRSRQVISYKDIRYLPIICYDLRFPVWCRNRDDYDILICVASWPDVRREAWNSLLKARAIENQCYVVGVNRTGTDNDGFNYAGDSVVFDPLGKILGKVDAYEEGSVTVEISLSELRDFRNKFPFWKDTDNFNLNI